LIRRISLRQYSELFSVEHKNGEFRIDETTSLWQLLVTIMLNKIRKQAKRHTAQRRNVDREVAGIEIPLESFADGPTPEDAAVLCEILEWLAKQLEPQELEIIRLRLQNYSTTEIAEQVGGTTRWTVRRTLDWIRHLIEKEFDLNLPEI
jgi:RNA polymerase sigma factor (sigma-70 family)